MDFLRILNWLEDLVKSFVDMSYWFTNPLTFGTISITPLELLTAGGLVAFLSVAIVKWVIS